MPNSITVAVVDDSIQCRKHLVKILNYEGYEVLEANDGISLEKILENTRPDLILLDIIMPGMNGFDVMEKIIKNRCSDSVPVIFLTGNDDNVSKIKAFDLGAVDYIIKPFNPAEVRARVNVHLRNAVQTNAIIRGQAEKLRQITQAREAILVKPSELPDAQFSVHTLEVLEAGGDFYDVIRTSQNRFVYFIADLSGHDIAASYMVPAIKALIKQNSSPVYSVHETISIMNRVLCEIMGEEKYLTCFYLAVDRSLGKITWSGAAHPPALFLPVNGVPELLKSDGDIVGMFKNGRYHTSEKKVEKGDKIVLFTDGLVESAKNGKVWAGNEDEILKRISGINKYPLNELPGIIVNSFIDSAAKLEDDVIVLVTEI